MTYFVTEQYLKTKGIITDNVDVTDFSPLVEFAARAFVEDMLGTLFFEDLLTKYNTETLDAAELLLVAKMQPAIAWRLMAKAGLTLTYQLKNKGYQKQSGDNSEAVELSEATFMNREYIQEAFFWEKKLEKFLIENKEDYPVFLSKENKNSTIKDVCCKGRSNFNPGIGFIVI